jgi:hypothetical protein
METNTYLIVVTNRDDFWKEAEAAGIELKDAAYLENLGIVTVNLTSEQSTTVSGFSSVQSIEQDETFRALSAETEPAVHC